MSEKLKRLAARVDERFEKQLTRVESHPGELSYEVAARDLLEVCQALHDEADFGFEQCMDVCAVDYLSYGQGEWRTNDATDTGFSRGVHRTLRDAEPNYDRRFAVVYHLQSNANNHRLRLKVFCDAAEPPIVPSVNSIWNSANWFEREAFDLYGILFDGHPDMRRILTDYGFVGHPFRKDFPLSGHVEVRFDPEKGRVVYQPVSIEPRTLVPKVIRKDHRYADMLKAQDNAKVKDQSKENAGDA
ncbi:MAG: NADH-quinone oxidoreductase subunit C [Gammaproteobacteria bacterium]|nr:NADH-quinone oxidoreductase subunit C [Gammaproteobacteria bacterium]